MRSPLGEGPPIHAFVRSEAKRFSAIIFQGVGHDLPHQGPARLQLVEQVHPVGQSRIGPKPFALLGASLVGGSEVA